VFRTLSDPPSPWESDLPAELLRLPEALARVDDPAFFAPFAPYFHPVLGWPSTPVECYPRLMFVKFRSAPVHEKDMASLALTALTEPGQSRQA